MAEGADMTRIENQPGLQVPRPIRRPRGLLERTTTRVALAGSALVLAGTGVGAKLGFFQRGDLPPAETPVATAPAAIASTEGPQLATPMPSLNPEASATATLETATPTATPEVKQEVPCLIVSPELCSKAEHAEWTDNRGTWTIIGMNLEKDTPIYSPSKGQNSKVIFTQPANFRGASANISNPEDPSQGTFILMGDIKLDNPTITTEVEPGTQIGFIGDTGEANFGYNFAVIVRKDSTAYNKLKNIFTETLNTPAKKVELNPPSTTAPQKSTPLRGTPPR